MSSITHMSKFVSTDLVSGAIILEWSSFADLAICTLREFLSSLFLRALAFEYTLNDFQIVQAFCSEECKMPVRFLTPFLDRQLALMIEAGNARHCAS
jgi:hypothetical protein